MTAPGRLRRSALTFLSAWFLSLGLACRGSEAAPAAAAGPPPSVTVVAVTPETVSVASEWVATLDGFVNAQIRPQVSGYLIRRSYSEGLPVKKGQVLFEIDSRPFQATLAQAEAQLAQAQAELGRRERDVARDTPLAKERAIPQSQLDNDIQGHLAAKASVKAAEAAIETAKLNVGFASVRSLIDGVAAIATAQIGDLVTPQSLLTTVSQIDPIKAYFSLTEQEYLRIAKQLNQGETKELWQGTALTLILSDGHEYPQSGSFLAADRQIDPSTGTIRISAAFPNPDHLLRPGQYGRVRADTQVIENALLVPQRAVSELQGAAQLRVLGPNDTVALRTVTLGNRIGNRFIVTRGLEPNDRVLIDSPQVREGTVVKPTLQAPVAEETAKAGADPAPAAASAAAPSPAKEK
ncbi:MAG TPA: efflux RND transporter periplasmic adaptor subunit [Polyangiaceae bacterium]|nr:efflux RND transporter periplasmic adaptor subunit [Polyangiaceae bacterium]